MALVPEWLSVAEAARRLGITTGQVRARIKAGQLKARRDNGPHLVLLAGEGLAGDAESAIVVQALIAELRGQIAAKDEQRRAREQELLRVQEQIRAKDQQIERLMVLLAQAQAQTQDLAQRLLPPPAPAPSETRPSGGRRWWPFRRPR